ncbi:hypothetical protein [Sphingomonas sp. 2R-10]|uniref:hypothetical protein n=1 Tax=Sphingomonas sp. 2R-10 TaxID=3045148 RepID=UPI0024B8FB82|nr:hypothetical protein [Sphingomonas sp. 2R-10]
MIGLPVLIGQFLFHWASNDLPSAASHLPVRALLVFAVLLAWAILRERHERKKQTHFRKMSDFHPITTPIGLIAVAVICSLAAKDLAASAGFSRLASMSVGLSIGSLIIGVVLFWRRRRNNLPKAR